MKQNLKNLFCCLFSVLFILGVAGVAKARAQAQITPQTIDFLFKVVARSNLVFIRNGEKHTCKEAAEHMMRKYDYFKSKVKTSEDFISLCASKSILSGKPYMVETSRGTIPVSKWLEQKLAERAKDRNVS